MHSATQLTVNTITISDDLWATKTRMELYRAHGSVTRWTAPRKFDVRWAPAFKVRFLSVMTMLTVSSPLPATRLLITTTLSRARRFSTASGAQMKRGSTKAAAPTSPLNGTTTRSEGLIKRRILIVPAKLLTGRRQDSTRLVA